MPFDIVTIEQNPTPQVLTQPAQEVSFPLSQDNQKLITEMKAMVLKLNGVGLAAPQIGIAKQIIVYHISEDAKQLRQDATETVPVTVLINPHYAPTSDAQFTYDWEGCFSVTKTTGKVPRYNKIQVTAFDSEGNQIKLTACGFTARVLQHEIDHIRGILITHRLTADCVQGDPKDMMALRMKEFTPTQKAIAEKIIAERNQNIAKGSQNDS